MKYLEDLLNLAENQEREYVEAVKHKRYSKWAKHCVAFANGNGGTIYFGVDKTGGILGVLKADKEIDFIKECLEEVINPKIEWQIEKLIASNTKIVIVLHIKKALSTPVYLLKPSKINVVYLRKNAKTSPATYQELKKFSPVTQIEVKTTYKAHNDKYNEAILDFCSEPRSRKEIQEHIGISSRPYFRENILLPLIESAKLVPTNPNPRASNQKYVRKEN